MSGYWQEEQDDDNGEWKVPEDILDVSFRLHGKTITVDHAWELSGEVHRLLPWFAEESGAALHQIHVAESGNGWQRPVNGDDLLHLSRRTRLTLRLPAERVANAKVIIGGVLNLSTGDIKLGEMSLKPMIKSPVVFSRYLDLGENNDEDAFLSEAFKALREQGINSRKMLCGRLQKIKTPQGDLTTRSLMIADLDLRDAVKLQERGMGSHRKLGCGVFLAHKGIEAVGERQK